MHIRSEINAFVMPIQSQSIFNRPYIFLCQLSTITAKFYVSAKTELKTNMPPVPECYSRNWLFTRAVSEEYRNDSRPVQNSMHEYYLGNYINNWVTADLVDGY